MGGLARIDPEHVIRLVADTRVGRGAGHDVQLLHHAASAPHASLRWDGKAWVLRDLNSLNGTFVNDSRLRGGERRRLQQGWIVRFGVRDESYRLIDAGPPLALARCLGEPQETVPESNGMIVLPNEQQPIATLFESSDGDWMCECEDELFAVHDRQQLTLEDRVWVLHIPEALNQTWEANRYGPTLERLSFHFAVGSDEEHMVLRLHHPDGEIEVPPRSYHYLLLTLARARLADASLPEAERGWLDRQELCRMLATDSRKLNVEVFRARRQLTRLGIVGAANLIERRPSNHTLRIGVTQIKISTL